ncbi:DMT family transporter [Bacillus kexueae]|uniref:DMT family transporter n=1 Tax=Aeribacillus kexueae TaxID=2078952 RepID=UPI001FAE8A23|nr:DMT family transporter [Bacillus kexueae]
MQGSSVRTKTSPFLKMSLAMIIFGSIGFFSVQTNLPSFELVFVRCVFATLFLSLCWFVTGEYKKDRWERKEIYQVLICGFFLVFNWVFLFKAFENMSVTIEISLYHLAPIFVLLIGSFIFKEKLTVVSVVATIVCFFGAVFIAGTNDFLLFSQLMSSGMIWGFLAALFYAFTTITGKGIQKMNAYSMTFLQTFLGIFFLIPFIDFSSFQGLSAKNWGYIIATGFIHTGIVYYLFFDSLRNLSTRLISILVFLDPTVAILLDIAFTGFRPSFTQIIGIFLIFTGMTLSFVKQRNYNLEGQTEIKGI